MEPGRERRSGQLVWTGGGGWVYLRGDRQDPAALGVAGARADGSGRGVHLHRQQAARGALRRATPATPRAGCPARPAAGSGTSRAGNISTTSWRWARWRWATGIPRSRPRPTRPSMPAWSGRLPPELEETVAAELCRLIPWMEQVRFVKTGAEGDGRGGAAGAGRDGTGGGARLRLPWLARLVPGPGPAAGRRTGPGAVRGAAVQRRRAHPESDSPRGRPAGRGGVRAGHSWPPGPNGSPWCRRRPAGSARC